MKNANGTGSIIKLSGNRRRPYAVKITTGYTICLLYTSPSPRD